jgi:glycosyltransferase involved in cell wall biosynthesis
MEAHETRHPAPRLMSVIIPVRNAATTLPQQFEALGRQTYTEPWEIVLADNGSTDGTLAIAHRHSPRGIELRVVDASARAGSSFARNRGAEEAKGDFLVFCDADDVVTPGWLAAMADAARGFDAVTGPQDANALNDDDVQRWRPPRPVVLPTSGFLPYAPSCNLGVWANVYAGTGGFREQYPQAHDVEWSWRVQLLDYSLGYAPGAVVQYRYRSTMHGVARQAYLSGFDSAQLFRDYRALGMPRPALRRTLRTWLWVAARSPFLLSRAHRGIWMRRTAEAWGRLRGSVRFRVMFL